MGVLDQSPIASGRTASDAVHETLALAEEADRLGYHRYWLAEHHNAAGLAGSTPEILIGQVAARTRHIRVGSGGVMMMHYSPLKVAENFRMLETLFPGRIDLGMGRAPGSDQRTAQALSPNGMMPPSMTGDDRFPYQLRDIMEYMSGGLSAGHNFSGVQAMPDPPGLPELWVLGSGAGGSTYAAHFGLPFCHAHFISSEGGEQAVADYRKNFQPSNLLSEPYVALGLFVMCADTEEEANRLAISRDLWLLRIQSGEIAPFPSVEEAEAVLSETGWGAHQKSAVERGRQRMITGTPDQVKSQLVELAARYGASEVVAVTICHDFAARLHSYRLLAQAFGLTERA